MPRPDYRVRLFDINPRRVRRFYAWTQEEAESIAAAETTPCTQRTVIEFRHAAGVWSEL